MELKPEQLVSQLGAGSLSPAYLIAGSEPLRVLETADAVRAAARAQGIDEREVFEAEGTQREPDWAAMKATNTASTTSTGTSHSNRLARGVGRRPASTSTSAGLRAR